jgi:hypothetical protein
MAALFRSLIRRHKRKLPKGFGKSLGSLAISVIRSLVRSVMIRDPGLDREQLHEVNQKFNE